jgi:ketosteroid isomerase-like protein
MSQENVELVRRAVEAFNEAGASAVVAMSEIYDTNIEFQEDPKLPEAGTYRGFEAVREYFLGFLDSFEDYTYDIEDAIDVGDMVLVFNRQRARGKSSGVEVDMRNSWLFTLRDGRITHIRSYWDKAQALEAAGLSE